MPRDRGARPRTNRRRHFFAPEFQRAIDDVALVSAAQRLDRFANDVIAADEAEAVEADPERGARRLPPRDVLEPQLATNPQRSAVHCEHGLVDVEEGDRHLPNDPSRLRRFQQLPKSGSVSLARTLIFERSSRAASGG